ncbi:MAG: transcription elongation factor GreA [Synergistaceae bacterium]|nr:transcription elongation factor GreA [Synergistaceae bacterium]
MTLQNKITENLATMTKNGYERLKAELVELRTTRRAEISKQLEEARSFGDLSENAEYAAAKDEQAKIEARILQLEAQLSKAKVVDATNLDTSKVVLGVTVTFEDISPKSSVQHSIFTYTIVGSEESDLKSNRISSRSPIGQALIGRGVGDKVDVKIPKGIRKLKIIDISAVE